MMKTYVYVDGFNFYYGAVKDTPFKWLNLDALFRIVLPKHNVLKVKYFTAMVSSPPHDPQKSIRQQIFLRALRTLPNIEIFLGHFLSSEVTMPLAGLPPGAPQKWVKVIKWEEKGSDVNLATHLLYDCVKGCFDTAVVVSADSDLKEPIRIIRQDFGKPVGVLFPPRRSSAELNRIASFVKTIRTSALKHSLFPPQLQDAQGIFQKPAGW